MYAFNMNLPQKIQEIKKLLNSGYLPGLEAQIKMAPVFRSEELKLHTNRKLAIKSSVLILLFSEDGILKTCLIQRPKYDGIHSGQIGFPGGKAEPDDFSYIHTALREAKEEIGVDPGIYILGSLTELFIPPSNFIVKPVVAYSGIKPKFIIDSYEVEELIIVKIDDLLRPDIVKPGSFVVDENKTIEAPCYHINGNKRIWGATAMILSELITVLKSIN